MDKSWANLGVKISDDILECVNERGFLKPTPIQEKCIPLFMQNKDVAAEAVTGSGKTLAFVIPVLEILKRREHPWKKGEVGALVVTPTRELAIQIEEVFESFLKIIGKYSKMLIIGGNSADDDVKLFKKQGAHIIIATPGRLEDIFQRSSAGFNLAASVKSLEVLVLDEADQLLDMGFKQSLDNIMTYLPKQRRTGLFSATQTDEVQQLVRAGLRNPIEVKVGQNVPGDKSDQRVPLSLSNYFMIVETEHKFNHLASFLKQRNQEKHMVFFSSCAAVDYFSHALQSLIKNAEILRIHRKKDNRNKIFSQFRNLSKGILLCTDVMGRGVDIPEVDWVIQFDPPSSASFFVHRCGRTARQGNKGNALIFLLSNEDAYINFLEINQKVHLQKMEPTEDLPNFVPKIQKLAIADRTVMDKGVKAFVSFIQFYNKHECRRIFDLKELEIGKLAQGFGLIQLPRMPEMKNRQVTDFTPVNIDTNIIPYKDKTKERERQKKLIEYRKTGSWPGKKKKIKLQSEPWSKQKKTKNVKKIPPNKRKMKFSDNDLDELTKDARLVKKFKKGKITTEQLDIGFGAKKDLT